MTRIVGIDPGVNGAVGILTDSGGFVDAFDMPTVIANKSSNRQMVDAYELARILRAAVAEARGEIVAVIENVQPMPSIGKGEERRSMGASSAFAFGTSIGMIRGVVATLGVSLELVAPARWKKHFALERDKEQARELAVRTWPQATLNLKRHHNRAEALLIARWYAQVHFKPVMIGDTEASAVPF